LFSAEEKCLIEGSNHYNKIWKKATGVQKVIKHYGDGF
jgi:hypothetical protein